MKITKTASGKTEIRISKSEWETIGKKAGWDDQIEDPTQDIIRSMNNRIDRDNKKIDQLKAELQANVNTMSFEEIKKMKSKIIYYQHQRKTTIQNLREFMSSQPANIRSVLDDPTESNAFHKFKNPRWNPDTETEEPDYQLELEPTFRN